MYKILTALPLALAASCLAAKACEPRPKPLPDWLSEPMARRSSVPWIGEGSQNARLLHGAFLQAERGERVNMSVFGGSMTAGVNCKPLAAGEPCMWSAQLQRHLDGYYGHGVLRVTNYALPSSSTRLLSAQLSNWQSQLTYQQIAILDYAVNDAPRVMTSVREDPLALPLSAQVVEATELVVRTLVQAGVAVLFVETFFTPMSPASRSHWADCKTSSSSNFHSGMHHAGKAAPSGLFDFLCIMTDDEFVLGNRYHRAHQDLIAPVAARYGVPIVSYRDAVWPDASQFLDERYWRNEGNADPHRQDPHPGHNVHGMISDLVFHNWQLLRSRLVLESASCVKHVDGLRLGGTGGRTAGERTGKLLSPVASLGAPSFTIGSTPFSCHAPSLLELSALGGEQGFAPAWRGASWRFYEDRPGESGSK